MSTMAARMVANRKYTNIMVFKDGIAGWKKAGFTTNITSTQKNIAVPILKPEELNPALEDYLIIDIRPSTTYKFGHLPDSRAMPLAYLTMLSEEVDKTSKIVIVDHNGKRSKIAAQWLISHGYADVSMLENGLKGYVDAGFSLDSN